MQSLKRFLILAGLSTAALATLPASAFVLTRVNTERAGLGVEGLGDRGRCQINNQEKREMTMVNGNVIYQVTPITLADPDIPEAKSQLQALTEKVAGVQATFPSDRPVVNYWAQVKGSQARLLLRSVQGGRVVAEDTSAEAQTLIKVLDKNCFSLSK